MFSKILIANRGEIACRIIQTAHRMGIRCVAVYSDADANALHVSMADEAFHIGPAPSSESYLRSDKIIEIAKQSGAQAIHPGYGFLSENTGFAEACEANGIVFIGPPSSAIAAMGSKSAAKAIMEKAGVPLVPGYHGDDQSPETLRAEAEKCGFPLLLKAVAGGGGKGMRVVENIGEFDDALAAAKREAKNAFGNPDMLIERYLTQPRHVEIQVFCDETGQGVYLAERDCSVQRRHQKVLEEAPAPGLSEETRKAMGDAAVKAAQAINYVGAGTVEFLYDVDGSFFFMEMNTRLQVEHPVTEMVTGQDLVEWQLKVAWGEPLPLEQSQVKTRGHALEARIYAEDPDQDFLPATGNLRYLSTPDESAHVRVDTGVIEGDEISIHYDPMIAKLIVWDETREQAINRMVQALEHYRIAGVKTNIRFLHALADSQPFREADLTTGFIDSHRELLFPKSKLDTHKALVLAAGFVLEERKSVESVSTDPWSPFGRRNSWRLNSEYAQPLQLQVGDEIHELKILEKDDHYQVSVDGNVYNLTAKLEGDSLQAVVDGHTISIHGNLHNDQLVLFYEGDTFQCTLYQENHALEDMAPEGGLTAPMNGAIVAVQTKVGDAVTAGQTLVIMEAMKMEHAIKAPADGVVSEIFFAEGEQVSEGAELIAIEINESSSEEAS
ncbi:acetyl/propionyl/methylcrotonyl-CoA carboxylase subunit alpha [Marinobacter sp. DY40_1A1]|uniref:acetyl-CoA carboxylase biotin carboxylase subunit n=1 Tax=Marinobacter sp. DY40_1A1 TaxID=2583229 RepID=UPI001906BCC9|nr:acetyl/propionyl/methylcrotonyl-CoA carboxylase subunit alpha [Marinobacter sp. DY40_1A1]MBK1886772.1 acetyl/propionyl/methylcrotonyl-CoA carboxylase subunit alpha [Marinobacter sp. DY40_1A1]